MYGIAKMLKLKFNFMSGWKGIDRSIYEISVFYSFRLFLFFLNPDYVAAPSLRSLRSKTYVKFAFPLF